MCENATANCHPREGGDPEDRHRSGFTLIELLIAIAIVLIVIAGELKVTRLMLRSSSLSRDTEAASAVLVTELAELRNRGLDQTEGVIPLPIPVEHLSDIPPKAEGELRLTPREDGRLVEAEAVIRWKSVTGPRELTMATLIRSRQEEAR
jgi:prepilin-type N-terminal cleavage/methylation domain-containing protein